jgi:hypothetical protein
MTDEELQRLEAGNGGECRKDVSEMSIAELKEGIEWMKADLTEYAARTRPSRPASVDVATPRHVFEPKYSQRKLITAPLPNQMPHRTLRRAVELANADGLSQCGHRRLGPLPSKFPQTRRRGLQPRRNSEQPFRLCTSEVHSRASRSLLLIQSPDAYFASRGSSDATQRPIWVCR